MLQYICLQCLCANLNIVQFFLKEKEKQKVQNLLFSFSKIQYNTVCFFYVYGVKIKFLSYEPVQHALIVVKDKFVTSA